MTAVNRGRAGRAAEGRLASPRPEVLSSGQAFQRTRGLAERGRSGEGLDGAHAAARRHPQGGVALPWRSGAEDLARRRAALPRPRDQPRRARSARRAHAAGGGEDRPPGSDRLPLHGPRPHLEGGGAAARLPEGATGDGRAVDHTFWLTPGHATEPGSWYAGTSPQGLFRSDDGGVTWEPFSSVNDDPQYRTWMGTVQDGTPDGPKLHSILVDPRDPAHLYFAMSSGGVHESLDRGRTWAPLVKGLEVVEGFDPAERDVPRPPLRAALPEQPRPPLPAEPLRHLPDRPAVERVGAHREEHAEAGRRHRLPDGGAPARRRHGVGLPDGRHDGVAAHQPRRASPRST